MREYDLIVIGGGAAGIMAAGSAAETGCRVLVCEKMEKPQRKVRITGKGRCNLTNMKPAGEFLAKIRAGGDFFRPAFLAFDNYRTKEFFEGIGVPLVVERGQRVFPASSRAWDIAEAHMKWARSKGMQIECHTEVEGLEINDGAVCGVTIRKRSEEREKIGCKAVIVATGGLSYPATGSTGDGLRFACDAGHSITEVRPSLTPLETDPVPAKEMNRLSLRNIMARLVIDGRITGEEFGELEFTETGISGPVALRLSRQAVDAVIEGKNTIVTIDMKPALSEEKLRNRLQREREQSGPGMTVGRLMGRLLPSAMIPFFLKAAGVNPDARMDRQPDAAENKIIYALKNFKMEVVDYRPFTEAVITAGGVGTEKIDPETMQSLLVKGLFFAGEVMDIDADTGGYNLQVAYSTGFAAGRGAAEYIRTHGTK